MKALLVLILAIVVGYLAYNQAYIPVLDALGISRIKIEKKVEVAVVAPKPEPKVELGPHLPADFAFLKLSKSAATWNLMFAADQFPIRALFLAPTSVVLFASNDVVTGLADNGLRVTQGVEIPASVSIAGVGFSDGLNNAIKDVPATPGMVTGIISGTEVGIGTDGITTLVYEKKSIVKREITGMATISATGSPTEADAHPPSGSPVGWLWNPEPFACYRAGKLLGVFDTASNSFRAAKTGEAPETLDFDAKSSPVIASALASAKPAPTPAPPEPPKPKEGEFVPPTFDPVEVITANWTTIPKGFFATPKPVKVMKELNIQMKVGGGTATTKVAAGGTVYAVSQEGPMLTITPAMGSPGRAQVPLDDTDVKAVFAEAYEQIKLATTERARQAFEAKKLADSQPKSATPMVTGAGANAKPARAEDGTYPLLLASMKAGQVTEIKPDNIKSWGDAKNEKIDKDTYWTVVVKYETQTMFGKFETEAQARVKDGKVEKWVYVGSGETVP